MIVCSRRLLPQTLLIVAMSTLLLPAYSLAQMFKMEAATQFRPAPPATQVIGGNPASARDWPATFVFRNSAGAACTATAIGTQVLLTAAHCIDNGAFGTVTLNQRTVGATCTHHPSYPRELSADFALCALNVALPALANAFENLNTTATLPAMDQEVTLLGYGCIATQGADRQFGILYKGNAVVAERVRDSLYIRTVGGAAVCFGDSGGAAYYPIDSNARRIVGVNSRGDLSTNSWISATAHSAFVTWLESWAQQNKVRVCGHHDDAAGCRQR